MECYVQLLMLKLGERIYRSECLSVLCGEIFQNPFCQLFEIFNAL